MRTGLHTNNTHDHAKIIDYYRRSGSKVFKALNIHDDLVAELRAMGVTIIGRVHTDNQRLSGDALKAFHAKLKSKIGEHPGVQFWEGFNEEFADVDQIGKYAQVEIARMQMCEDLGVKAVIGCFSQGTPALPDDPDPAKRAAWERFRPALERALTGGHWLELHEYAGPYMQFGCIFPNGKNRWNHARNEFTGMSAEGIWNTNLRGYHTLRYRLVYDLLRTWGLGDLPLFIGEGGIDDTWPRPGGQGRGYKAHADSEWAKFPGIGDYAEQRRWYMWQVSHDKFVKGVVDFGWEGTATGWPDFDLSTDQAMVDRIIAREADLPLAHFGAAPVPAPPPTPSPTPPPGGNPVSDRLHELLAAEFGAVYDDLRAKLPANPRGPNGPFGRLDPARVDGIAFHHTAGPKSQEWSAIAAFHVNTRGWAGIGYHIGIRQGRVAYLGDVTTARAHVEDENHHLIGVVFTGNYQVEQLDPADLALGRRVVAVLDKLLGRQVKVGGHREFSPPGHTVCPGTALAAVLPTIRGAAPLPAPAINERQLWSEADSNQTIRLNPKAGLQKAIIAAGYLITSDEWQHSPRYIAQRGESPTGGGAAVWVYDSQTGAISRHNRS